MQYRLLTPPPPPGGGGFFSNRDRQIENSPEEIAEI